MTSERPVAIITDTGSSVRPEDSVARDLGVTILPLNISFYEEGQWIDYHDLQFTSDEFYQKMAVSEKLPKTSGAIIGRALEAYKKISKVNPSIVSVHLTSEHSAIYESALNAANTAREENPDLAIEVIDSRQISIGSWLLVEQAARLSKDGAGIDDIKRITLETIPKIETMAALHDMKHVIAGGRVPAALGFAAMALKINPVLEMRDGKLSEYAKVRTFGKAKQVMIDRVLREDKEIVRLAVIHANNPSGAEEVKTALSEFYSNEICIHESGPVFGVHAGPGSIGVSFQRA